MPVMAKIREMERFDVFMYDGFKYVKINNNMCLNLDNGTAIYPSFNSDSFEVVGYYKYFKNSKAY